MLTFRFKKLSESKLELKFWDDCWFIEGSDPFNISQVFDEIGVFIVDVGLELFHSRASTERVPEVNFIEEASKGTAFWEGYVVFSECAC